MEVIKTPIRSRHSEVRKASTDKSNTVNPVVWWGGRLASRKAAWRCSMLNGDPWPVRQQRTKKKTFCPLLEQRIL